MHWPYTLEFVESFLATQWGSALLLTAMLVFWRVPAAARGLLFAGAWVSALSTTYVQNATALEIPVGPFAFRHVLLASATLGSLAAILSGRPVVALLAAAAQVPLWWLSGYITMSDGELAALHLCWIGVLTGVLGANASPRAKSEDALPSSERSTLVHDLVLSTGATLLAAAVCLVVLHQRDGDADEWGYTYQAAVFAKGRAYAQVPRCEHYFESMYVFELSGRLFSQYTPGWPMFITPFVWVDAVWLSGPFSLGVMTWGMARLGRSVARGFGPGDAPPSEALVRSAGTWCAVLAALGTSVLTNAGSRFSHVYTLGLYAWSLEALAQVTRGTLTRRQQVAWGLVLGAVSVQMVAVRPADGAFMGLGLAVVFLWSLARRRVPWRALVSATASFAVCSAIVLVILRLQIGKWFATGYSLNEILRPWNVVKFSTPKPYEWKYGLPLATGAYCWWPVSLPLGLAGLCHLRGSARRIGVVMLVGCLAYIPFCMFLDVSQRGVDWGYGPRYLMILVVPMAVGCAVAFSPLARAAFSRGGGRSAFATGGPLAVVLAALATAWVRIAPPEWATVAQHTTRHGALLAAIEDQDLDHAIVLAADGTTGFADVDLTTNLPLDLYPSQPVLIATDRKDTQGAVQCLRAAYPERKLYRATGREEVKITPLD